MGCCASSQTTSNQVMTPQMRRRLSVGVVDANENVHESPQAKAGLIMELSSANLMELLDKAAGEGGRRWSIGSLTDSDLKRRSSFASKTVLQEGDAIPDNIGIGFSCKKGLKPESPNQDSWIILNVVGEFSIYGVFDGHGSKGHDLSQFVKENMPKVLLREETFRSDTKTALTNSFQKIQTMIEVATNKDEINAARSGTTCTVAVRRHSDNMLFVAHCGDSRAILATRHDGELQAKPLTSDHKPNEPEEKRRIQASGGQVLYDGYSNYRVYARRQNYPGLNMSRAMGDLMGHYEAGISAVPAVKEIQLTSEDEILILCSDGVWEFMPNDDAVDLVSTFSPDTAMAAADALAKQSWERWLVEQDGMVVDDITALTIWLTSEPIKKDHPSLLDSRVLGA
jgi:serine/threonine protein phosphatase PrpC